MKYNTLLFDADDTLFDFQKAEAVALEKTLTAYGLGNNPAATALYHRINKQLWIDFEAHKVSKSILQQKRFTELFKQLHIDGDGIACSLLYVENLSKGNYFLPDAVAICKELSDVCSMYLVTNGIAKVQHARFATSAIQSYFRDVFVSEESGYQKPDVEYFTYVFERISNFDKDSVLLIGDSLSSDMQGGINTNVDTCWFNPNHVDNTLEIPVTYEIKDLKQLVAIVKASK